MDQRSGATGSTAGLETVRFDGFGPVNLGMTRDEAMEVVGRPLWSTPTRRIPTIAGTPPGDFATELGNRVGSTEAEVVAAYGHVVTVQRPPHEVAGIW